MNKRTVWRAACTGVWNAFALLTMAAWAGAQDVPPVHVAPQDLLEPAPTDEPGIALEAELGPGCCDDSCPCAPHCCCGPTWSFSAGAIFLNRSNPDNDPLYHDNVAPLLGSNLDLGWQTGYEFALTRHDVTGRDALVARLLVVDGWSATALARIPGNTQINTEPSVVMVGPRDVLAEHTSELISFELNYVWESQWSPALKWLTGFRTLEVDETLAADLVYPPGGFPTAYHAVETRNRLYGFQAGADLTLYEGSAFALRGVGSAGVYGNAARQRSAAWDDVTAPVFAVGDQSQAAFVGELGLSGKYALTEGFSFCADYRVLWASGLALAPEQVPVTNFNLGSGIDTDATAFYHGVFVGLEWAY